MSLFFWKFMLLGALSLFMNDFSFALHIAPEDIDLDLLPSYDYIIVGGGISGLVVANRLSEDSDVTVLVLEVGPLDNYEAAIMVPKEIADIALYGTTQYYYNYTTTPQTYLDGNTRTIPQGRLIGGGSCVNAMVWQRGFRVDYDAWESLGNPGWGWDGLLPYFKKSETYTPASAESAEEFNINYESEYHGFSGPVQVSYPNYIYKQSKNMNDGLEFLGVSVAFDPADGNGAGASFLPSTIHPTNQSRSDARRVYYDPFISRPNFHVATRQQVTRILSSVGENSTLVFTGVEFATDSSSTRRTVNATREVILAAGAIHTAQLLQLSGLGPKALLDSLDIPVLVDLPGVGQNFQDHWGVDCFYPYANVIGYESPLRLLVDPIYNEQCKEEYYADRTGPWTSGQLPETLAFIPLSQYTPEASAILTAATQQPAAQYLPPNLDASLVAGYAAQKALIIQNLATNLTGGYEIFHNNAGILVPSVLHPFSRGTVAITTSEAFTEPSIDPRYGSNPLDIQIVVEGMKFQRRLLLTPSFLELLPTHVLPPDLANDALLEIYVKVGLKTNYHPSGTAAMMPRDMGGVVDPNLVVYGTSNLRVVDAGMIPLLPGSHIAPAVYAVAEKAADIIKATYA